MSSFGQKNGIKCILVCAAEFMVPRIVFQLWWSYNMLKLLGVSVLIALVQHFIINQRQKHFWSKNYKACYVLAMYS